tara:strand:+ start:525 stop:725 length:201 start_codon:yes stop_codon:yes gene_type:complete
MANKSECPITGGMCEKDVVSKALNKVGICRSMMITLALLPFSWDGVMWAAGAVKSLWDAATTAVGS